MLPAAIRQAYVRDLVNRDGSYDFVIGGSHQTEGTTVRVIEDFLSPRNPVDQSLRH